MEENIQTTEQMEQTSTDSFLDGWDDADDGVMADQPEAEQHEAEAEEEEAPEATEQTEPAVDASVNEPAQEPAAPKVWNLRYMDNDKTVNEQEMVTLAQKGLDYDRIRTKYDESKPVMELFSQFARKSGMDIPAYVAYLRTQAKKADGMSEAEAKRTVELEDREAAVAASEEARARAAQEASRVANAQAQAEARRKADIEEFSKTFPDVARDPKAIPASVWNDVKGGMSLVAAYAKYAVAKAKNDAAAQVAVSAKNESNAARATGSMKSVGNDTKTRDPFLEGWDS
jgi:hypothetical protein